MLTDSKYKKINLDEKLYQNLVEDFRSDFSFRASALELCLEHKKFFVPNLGECYFKLAYGQDVLLLNEIFRALPLDANVLKLHYALNREDVFVFSENGEDLFDSKDLISLFQKVVQMTNSKARFLVTEKVLSWEDKFFARDMHINFNLKLMGPNEEYVSFVILSVPLSIFKED